MRKLIKDFLIEKVPSKTSNISTGSPVKSSPDKIP